MSQASEEDADEKDPNERAIDSLLSGGERVSKGRQRRDRENDE